MNDVQRMVMEQLERDGITTTRSIASDLFGLVDWGTSITADPMFRRYFIMVALALGNARRRGLVEINRRGARVPVLTGNYPIGWRTWWQRTDKELPLFGQAVGSVRR